MANCSNITKPSDYGGTMPCAQLEITLNEIQIMCAELNALLGGSSVKRIDIPIGTLTLKLAYQGNDIDSGDFIEVSAGLYRLTIPTGSVPISGLIHATDSDIDGSDNLTIEIIDTDGRDLHFLPGIVNKTTWQQMDVSPFNPSQPPGPTGTITSVFQNMTNAGSAFMIQLVFLNTL